MMYSEILLSRRRWSMIHCMGNIVLYFLQNMCHWDKKKDIDYLEENNFVYKKYKHSNSVLNTYYKIPGNYSTVKLKDCF